MNENFIVTKEEQEMLLGFREISLPPSVVLKVIIEGMEELINDESMPFSTKRHMEECLVILEPIYVLINKSKGRE